MATPSNNIESESTKSQLPTEFHHFPNLPVELRIKILGYASKQPQNIIIACQERFDRTSRTLTRTVSHTRHYQAPAALQVNQESRNEALKRFRPLFIDKIHMKTIFIDYELDSVCITDLQAFKAFHLELKETNYLETFKSGLRHFVYVGWNLYFDHLFDFIATAPQLKTLKLHIPGANNQYSKLFESRIHRRWKERGLAESEFPSIEFISARDMRQMMHMWPDFHMD